MAFFRTVGYRKATGTPFEFASVSAYWTSLLGLLLVLFLHNSFRLNFGSSLTDRIGLGLIWGFRVLAEFCGKSRFLLYDVLFNRSPPAVPLWWSCGGRLPRRTLLLFRSGLGRRLSVVLSRMSFSWFRENLFLGRRFLWSVFLRFYFFRRLFSRFRNNNRVFLDWGFECNILNRLRNGCNNCLYDRHFSSFNLHWLFFYSFYNNGRFNNRFRFRLRDFEGFFLYFLLKRLLFDFLLRSFLLAVWFFASLVLRLRLFRLLLRLLFG
uniref:Uncharacterized protein n=1 Tax=Arcella intermedia TaxID=1963864 RepID=A0A6B2L4Q8_9EUKA